MSTIIAPIKINGVLRWRVIRNGHVWLLGSEQAARSHGDAIERAQERRGAA